MCTVAYRRAKSSRITYTTCVNCNVDLSHKPENKFCTQSCAAKYNNNRRSKETHNQQRETLKKTLSAKGIARTDAKQIYKVDCAFRFNIYQYLEIPGYALLLERGMYNHQHNPTGVVRDHIISKEYGWRHHIPAEVISHPANCQFITNQENVEKSADCHMTIQELMDRIKQWDQKGVIHLPRKTLIKTYTTITKTTRTKKPKTANMRSDNQKFAVYRWVLQSRSTNDTIEITNMVEWLKTNLYSPSVVYGKNPTWIILEKYNLRTGERLK